MNLSTYLGFDNPLVRLWMRFQAARYRCHLLCGPYAWDLTKDTRVIRISRRQFAGVSKLAADFDDLFDALVPSHAGNRSLLDFSRLQLHTYREADLKFELAQWPEPDAPIDAYLEIFQPSPEDLIFDLGAEYGISTYVLSQVAGRVVAFEQELNVRAILERNIHRHALANVTVAKESVNSLTALIRLYGDPVFCRINLDHLAEHFLLFESQGWTSKQIFVSARSNSKRVRLKFAALLKASGYDITLDHAAGLIWGRPGLWVDPG